MLTQSLFVGEANILGRGMWTDPHLDDPEPFLPSSERGLLLLLAQMVTLVDGGNGNEAATGQR